MAIKLSETLYFVSDFERACAAYETMLGGPPAERHAWGFARWTLEGGHVGLLDRKCMAEPSVPAPRAAFQADDIEAEAARLTAAGIRVEPIQGKPGEIRSTTFQDADGNRFFVWQDC